MNTMPLPSMDGRGIAGVWGNWELFLGGPVEEGGNLAPGAGGVGGESGPVAGTGSDSLLHGPGYGAGRPWR